MGRTSTTFDYAEVVFELCTGHRNTLEFDSEISFRDARRTADITESILLRMAQTGRTVGRTADVSGWFVGMPPHAHVVRVAVLKCNRHSQTKRQIRNEWVPCVHVQQVLNSKHHG